MRHFWIVIGMVTILGVGGETASVPATKAVTAEKKARALEKKVVDGEAPPPPSPKIKKTEVQAVDPAGKGTLNDPITCLSRAIYWEARGDGTASMEAIANVVMNRLGHEGFPDTVCKIIKEGKKDGFCQFTWWCSPRSDEAKDEKSYALAKEIARKALNRQLPDRTAGALYFHQRKVTPAWSKKFVRTAKIGQFFFYKPRGVTAK